MIALHATLGLTSWAADPTVLAGTAGLILAYTWLVLRRWLELDVIRGGSLAFAAGILVLLLALESPIDAAGDHYLFSLHMLQHMLLAMVVPPLLLLGLPASWLAAVQGRLAPPPAAALFNAVLVLWHLPLLYEATLRSEPIHVVEHLSFIGSGLIVWWPVVTSSSAGKALSVTAKFRYLTTWGMVPMILGAVFVFFPRPLYPFYTRATRILPLSALQDQQLAGGIMLLVGALAWAVTSWILLRRRASQGVRRPLDALLASARQR